METQVGHQSVPLLDLKAQYARIGPEISQATSEVLNSQEFVLGRQVAGFEEDLARFVGARYAVGLASGTDALLLSLMALGIGPGDEVITTPFTFFATAGAIARVGARPVFADVEPHSFNIDPEEVGKRVSRRTRAIIPVHLFGRAAEMDPVMRIARRHGLRVVEDAAQAIGTSYRGRSAGTIGDIGCFSFYPSKVLGAWGDAGAVVTGKKTLAEKVRSLRVHGQRKKRYVHHDVGVNSRLDALQAAVLRVKMRHLESWIRARREVANRYRALFISKGLVKNVVLPMHHSEGRDTFSQFVIKVRRRDALKKHLAARGVGTEVYYPLPMHLQKCFSKLGYRRGDMPVAEELSRRALALPMYAELTLEQQEYVVGAIAEFFISAGGAHGG